MTVMNTIARSGLATARDLRAAMEGRSRRSATTPMFSTFLEKWRIGADQAPLFVYYLKRHIEVDSDQHGPAAKAILDAATADDPQRELEVLSAARQSIEARIKLWDGLLASLNRRKLAGVAAS